MKRITIMILLPLMALALAGCEVSTANLQEVRLCSDPGDDTVCASDESTFKADTEEIYVTGELRNAPEGTTIAITWRYLKGDVGDEPRDLDTIDLEADGSAAFHSSLSAPSAGWPGGEYEVVLDLGTDNSDPITKKFTIESGADPDAVISNLKTCDDPDGNLCPEDVDSFSPDTPKIYLSGNIAKVPADTELAITWRYLGGEAGPAQDIDTIVLQATDTPNVFSSDLPAGSNGWPMGDYEIIIEVDGKEEGAKEFTVQ